MQTELQPSEPAGSRRFVHTDESGVEWNIVAEWSVIGGRVECSALSIDSYRQGRVTSVLVRQVERRVREERERYAKQVKRLASGGGEVARRAARQVPAFDRSAPAPRPRGRPRDEVSLLAQAEAVRAAWETRRPLLEALRELDPHAAESTYRKRLDRVRRWDREHGPGILTDVGRAKRTAP